MADTCWSKVIDALGAVIAAQVETGEPLDGWTLLIDPSSAIAVDEETKTIVLWPVSTDMEQSEEQHQTFHRFTIDIEFIAGQAPAATLTRTVLEAMAHTHAALAADRTLGGMLHELQEEDIAPTVPEGRDAHGASIQYITEFYTARDDWFTIYGQAGATF